jgi:hypothetical protein
MSQFQKIAENLDVAPLLDALHAEPQHWNAYPLRNYEGSPHHGVDDIWVRYAAPSEIGGRNFAVSPHISVWYPVGLIQPAVQTLALRAMRLTGAAHLGGILITRINPGGQVKPHDDRHTWHSEWYTSKVYIPLQTNPLCVNFCEDEHVAMETGSMWSFDNLRTHGVTNSGDEPRITLIVSMRQ